VKGPHCLEYREHECGRQAKQQYAGERLQHSHHLSLRRQGDISGSEASHDAERIEHCGLGVWERTQCMIGDRHQGVQMIISRTATLMTSANRIMNQRRTFISRRKNDDPAREFNVQLRSPAFRED
jgi:hypothetical protein